MIYMADVRLMFPFERNNLDRTLDNSQLISMAPVVVLNFAFLNFYSTVFFPFNFCACSYKNHQTGDKNNLLTEALHL